MVCLGCIGCSLPEVVQRLRGLTVLISTAVVHLHCSLCFRALGGAGSVSLQKSIFCSTPLELTLSVSLYSPVRGEGNGEAADWLSAERGRNLHAEGHCVYKTCLRSILFLMRSINQQDTVEREQCESMIECHFKYR